MSQDQLLRANNGKLTQSVPDRDVTLKAKRRTFSAEYKSRLLEEAAQCTQLGERGALLRREGLYASHLTHRGQELRAGALAGLQTAYAAHPEGFVKGRPSPAVLPREVWINRPEPLLELSLTVLY